MKFRVGIYSFFLGLCQSLEYHSENHLTPTMDLPSAMTENAMGQPNDDYRSLLLSDTNESLPNMVTSPFSTLWPNGSIPHLGVSDMQISAMLPALKENVWELLSPNQLNLPEKWFSSVFKRMLGEHRFGNFLNPDVPKDAKRQIWNEFLADSRKAQTVEEQNNLIRKLEKGQRSNVDRERKEKDGYNYLRSNQAAE